MHTATSHRRVGKPKALQPGILAFHTKFAMAGFYSIPLHAHAHIRRIELGETLWTEIISTTLPHPIPSRPPTTRASAPTLLLELELLLLLLLLRPPSREIFSSEPIAPTPTAPDRIHTTLTTAVTFTHLTRPPK